MYRLGRNSTQNTLYTYKVFIQRLNNCLIFAVIFLYVLEYHGWPGLRWNYEYLPLGNGNEKLITSATYITPVGMIIPNDRDNFYIIDFILVENHKPSYLIKKWLDR